MDPAHHPCSLRAPGKSQGRAFHPKAGLQEAGVLLSAFRAWVSCRHVGRQAGLHEEGAMFSTQAARNQAAVYPSRVVCMGAQLHLPTGDQLLGLDKQGFKEWWVGQVGRAGGHLRGPGIPDVCWDKAHGFEGLLSNPSPPPSHAGGQAAAPV